MKTELSLGIDIGGTNTVYGFADAEGHILTRSSIRTDEYDDPEIFAGKLAKLALLSLQALEEDYKLTGIGIGAPNGNYYNGTIEFAPNLKWQGVVHLADLFRKHFDLPVVLTNDANAAAIGEMMFGAAKGMKDFILITLGTGLGSGIVANGRMIYGHDGFAGEIGHMIVDPKGRLCGCGRRGCLETYASATGITRTVRQFLEECKDDSLLRKFPPEELNSKMIYEAATMGDRLALEAFDYTTHILGMKLADAVAFSSPEAIILFGGLANAKEFIFEPVKHYMELYMLKIFQNKVKILPSQLPENDAAILGAAAMVWEKPGYVV